MIPEIIRIKLAISTFGKRMEIKVVHVNENYKTHVMTKLIGNDD